MNTRHVLRTLCRPLLLAAILLALPAAGAEKKAAPPPLSVNTVHGQTTVTYQGKQVFSGPTTGKVTARSLTSNGKEFAAVFDGDKVIWENEPGAARHLKKHEKQFDGK